MDGIHTKWVLLVSIGKLLEGYGATELFFQTEIFELDSVKSSMNEGIIIFQKKFEYIFNIVMAAIRLILNLNYKIRQHFL